MERKILKEKVRRLRVWIMVIVMAVSCLFGNVAMNVWAAENTLTINYYSDKAEITSETDAKITSTEYDTSITYDTDDSADVTVRVPTVEKEGYFFEQWTLVNANGEQTYEDGSAVNEISYSFEPDSEGNITIESDALIISNIIGGVYLDATWEAALKSSITYAPNGGTLVIDGKEYSDSELYSVTYVQPTEDTISFSEAIITETPTKAESIFTGWEWNEADSSGSYSDGMVSGVYGNNYTLSAGWRSENVVNVSYSMAEGYESIGSLDSEIQTKYQESVDSAVSIILPDVTVADGSNTFFIGWKCYRVDGSSKTEITDLNGYTDIYGTSGSDTGISGYPEGTELNFDYPTDEANAGGNIANYAFEAQFVDAERIVVNYDFNDETTDTGSTTMVYQENPDDTSVTFYLAEAPTREGYTFVGWQSSLEADSDSYDSAGSEVICDLEVGEITFTAQWEESDCTVNLIYDAGEGVVDLTGYMESLSVWELETTAIIGSLPEAEKTGYLFAGWTCETEGVSYDEETGTLTWDTSAKDVTEISFQANYAEMKYLTVNYNADGGENTVTSPMTVYQTNADDTRVEVILADAPVKEGYTFLGWKDSRATEDAAILEPGTYIVCKLSTKTITFIAQWEKTDCTVTMDYALSNGNITSDNYSQSIQVWELDTSTENIILPEVERTGFFFDGWAFEDGVNYNEETGILSWGSPAKEIGEITISARWAQIISSGKLTLQTTEKYHLNAGNWTVEGDNTVYAGGNDFYVSETGDYEFSEKEE